MALAKNIPSALSSIVLVFILGAMGGQSQSISSPVTIQTSEVAHIRWVSQFPPEITKGRAQGLFDRISEFFMGKKPPVIMKPVSILPADPENFIVLDQGYGAIVQVDHLVGDITQFQKEQFKSLIGICRLPNEGYLFTESQLNIVFLVDNVKNDLSIFNEGISLNRPTGIAFSKLNNEIWVVETGAHRIVIFNKNGKFIRTIGQRGNALGEFNFPTSIWIDDDGIVYIVDSMNFRVQVFSPLGEAITAFGQIGDATGYFARPKGIATDSHGNIYVVDALFHTVQIFDKSGNYLFRFGSQGRDKGQFWMPAGIYIDEKDYIYVADSYNSRIQIFQLINADINDEINKY